MKHIALSIVIKTFDISVGSDINVSINNAINTYIDNTIINISKNPIRFCSVWSMRFIVAANGRPDRALPKAGVVWAVLWPVFIFFQ